MKLSINFGAARPFFPDTETAARAVRDAGFFGIDLGISETPLESVLTEAWSDAVRREAEILRNAGLEIVQCHLHYQNGHELLGDGSYKVFEDTYLAVWEKELRLCKEIGCKIAAAHLFFHNDPEETLRGNMILLEKLMPVLEETQVILAIENTFGGGEAYADNGTTTAEQIMTYVEHFASPYLGVCLDSGHAVCTGQNAEEMVRRFGKALKATHLNSSSARDSHLIPGSLYTWIDPIDYKALIRLMKDMGFDGVLNLELSSGTFPRTPAVGRSYLQLTFSAVSAFAGE